MRNCSTSAVVAIASIQVAAPSAEQMKRTIHHLHFNDKRS